MLIISLLIREQYFVKYYGAKGAPWKEGVVRFEVNKTFFRFGHYSEEMFRACRLVVDTGIHAFGWSRQEAVQFMLDHTATPEHEIQIEINRFEIVLSW